LVEANIPDHAAQRKFTYTIYQRKDFNVANLVFAEGLGHGLFSESRTDEGDRSVDPKRRISTSCSKHQVAA